MYSSRLASPFKQKPSTFLRNKHLDVIMKNSILSMPIHGSSIKQLRNKISFFCFCEAPLPRHK